MSATTWVVSPGAMLVAIATDIVVGEPPRALHPVVGIGRYLHRAGARLPARAPVRAFAGGAVAWLFGAAVLVAAAWGLQEGIGWIVSASPSMAGDVAAAVALGILLKPLLAWRMLREEVGAVECALARGIDAGRARIARLASRHADALDAVAVRETAIESLAENLNDSVVAQARAGIDLTALRGRGIKLRHADSMGLPGRVRLSAQPPGATQALLEALAGSRARQFADRMR